MAAAAGRQLFPGRQQLLVYQEIVACPRNKWQLAVHIWKLAGRIRSLRSELPNMDPVLSRRVAKYGSGPFEAIMDAAERMDAHHVGIIGEPCCLIWASPAGQKLPN